MPLLELGFHWKLFKHLQDGRFLMLSTVDHNFLMFPRDAAIGTSGVCWYYADG